MDSVIVFCAKYLFVVVILAVIVVLLQIDRRIKPRMAAAVILAGILALIASRIAGKLYYDPRPFVTHNVKPLIPHAPDNGFPSDHALLTMTLTAILYFYSRRWMAVALIATVIVGVARVMAHIHSPIDIIGAWAIGIAAAAAAQIIINHLRWFNPTKIPRKPTADN